MVGAVLVKGEQIIGRGWHHRAGQPHGEIEAIQDAASRGNHTKGATLYVTLEPCSTHGRTPPCTDAIMAAGIKRVVVGATDPNPRHAGKAFEILGRARIAVTREVLTQECERLNEAFNHWVVHRTPFVTVKAAMTLDGKIATAAGESKWITGAQARAYAMNLRQGADAILVGINTILADDPNLTVRAQRSQVRYRKEKQLRRIVLDARARTPLESNVVSDNHGDLTTIAVSELAPAKRVNELSKRVNVVTAPITRGRPQRTGSSLDLAWLLKRLGGENVTSLLVEGGGEVNASFLFRGLAHRVAFFYAPKVMGGRDSIHAVAGKGIMRLDEAIRLTDPEYRKLGDDLLLTARIM
jgi:diaminohydroxyphosphoribosylaminopyrimidine deaminase/5-amino-6-(5-phosphoribosylamino)uracil reductase